MTDEKALQLYALMRERWGDKLPDPDVHPASFSYFVKLYRYLSRNNIL